MRIHTMDALGVMEVFLSAPELLLVRLFLTKFYKCGDSMLDKIIIFIKNTFTSIFP